MGLLKTFLMGIGLGFLGLFLLIGAFVFIRDCVYGHLRDWAAAAEFRLEATRIRRASSRIGGIATTPAWQRSQPPTEMGGRKVKEVSGTAIEMARLIQHTPPPGAPGAPNEELRDPIEPML